MVGPGELLSPSEIKSIVRRFGLRPKKSLGQNFMVDPNAIRKVMRLAAVQPGDRVLEVGGGIGTLTAGLARVAKEVIVIEIDRMLIPALEEVVASLPNVRVIQADALRLDFTRLTRGEPHRSVSNLPYNIATPLVMKLLQSNPEINDLSFVVQLEVAERLVAGPGSKSYGSISVMIAFFCDAQITGRISRSVFWPQPNVDSAVVRLIRRSPAATADPRTLQTVVRAAFSQRRKTIRNSLSAALGIEVAEVEGIISAAGLDPAARAETLSLHDFAALSRQLDQSSRRSDARFPGHSH